jgi:hypothetical protein
VYLNHSGFSQIGFHLNTVETTGIEPVTATLQKSLATKGMRPQGPEQGAVRDTRHSLA